MRASSPLAAAARRANKERLARLIRRELGVICDPSALFDVHIKRIHEYKRQLLNILETIALYQAIRAEPTRDWVPRVKMFAGKAAASYARAKLIIKLANDVAQVVNADPVIGDRLKVVSCRTTTSAWPRRSFRPRTCRSRFPPPEWKPPAPAT